MLMRLTDVREDDTGPGRYEMLRRIADSINSLPEETTLWLVSDDDPLGDDGIISFTCRGLGEGLRWPIWECVEYGVECYLTVNYGLGGGLIASTWGLNRFPDGSPGITFKAKDVETILGWRPDGEPLRIEKGVIMDAYKTE